MRVWDATTNISPLVKKVHQGLVRSIEFSSDGQRFVTASDDKTARIWKVEPDNIRKLSDDFVWTGGGIASATFSPNSERIAITSTDGKIFIWDPKERSSQILYSGNATATASAGFSPNGKLIVASSEAEGLRVWNLETKDFSQLTDVRGIRTAEFNVDSQHVVTGSNNGKATLWDVKAGANVRSYEHRNGVVLSAHFSADGKRIVTASSDRTARVWDTDSGSELVQLLGHGGDVYGARFSMDGTRIVTASGDHKIRVWDAQTGAQIVRFAVNGDPYDAAFTQDGGRLIVALDDGDIDVFNVHWTTVRGKNLVSSVCEEKLTDVMEFTSDDVLNPILSTFRGQKPCWRTGP